MKHVLALAAAGLVVLLGPAALADDEGDAETPAEALRKASSGSQGATSGGQDCVASDATSFLGGKLVIASPDADIYEPMPMGSKSDFERKGYEVVVDNKIEVIIDREGKIYADRNYQGIIPGIRNAFDARRLERLAKKVQVLWVGFQPMAAVSRVFWQLTDPAPVFEVNRIDAQTVEVFFPNARIPEVNTGRPLVTSFFGGPVDVIDGARVRGGARFTIKLKHAANYLYRFEAPFLYVDFEVGGQ